MKPDLHIVQKSGLFVPPPAKQKLVIGDVVALKSGGPLMTVVAIQMMGIPETEAIMCAWTDNIGQPHVVPIPEAALNVKKKEA